MIYRTLVLALVIAVAGCEMTTAPEIENSTTKPGVQARSSASTGAIELEPGSALSTHDKSDFNKTLAQIRSATAKYHRLEAAIADGYVAPDPDECVSSPDGAMGVHYVNFGLTGDGTFEPTKPEVLVYEPQKNGRSRLVAVEWVVFQDNMTTPDIAPEFFGHTFDGPSTHGLPPHYELHVWLWRNNPNGLFAMWNPKVSCPS